AFSTADPPLHDRTGRRSVLTPSRAAHKRLLEFRFIVRHVLGEVGQSRRRFFGKGAADLVRDLVGESESVEEKNLLEELV
ncbi:hypothetical protein B8W95_13530, partial [Staphylococcus pasteuri]